MSTSLDERIDAYLDGALSRDQTRALERELAESPAAAQALSSALALRELLVSLPPTRPPEGLEEEIFQALPLRRRPREEKAQAEDGLLRRFRAALGGASWSVRGPALALGGASLADLADQPAAAGLTQVRWMLGPLGAPRPPRPETPRMSLWQRALGVAWRRL